MPAAAAARRAGLQGRRRLATGRGPGPPGAARRGSAVHRDLAGRGEPVAVGTATGRADQHPPGHDRARHRGRGLLRGRHGGDRRARRGRALRAAGQRGGLPRPAGCRLARPGLRRARPRRGSRAGQVGRPACQRHRAAVPHAVPAAGDRAGRAGRLR